MNLSNNQSPVFIGGQMKSGTTLLRGLLSQHPNIFGGLETHWFDLDSTPIKNLQSIKKLCFFYEINEEELDNIMIAMRSEGVPFIDAFLTFATRKADKTRWVEKTPGNIGHLNRIFTEFEGAYFLHVVRDYRDIYSSWKLAKKGDVSDFIYSVKTSYETLMDYRDHARYREIKYEDLVYRVDATLTSTLQFIHEKPSNSCVEIDTTNSVAEFDKVKAFTGKESGTLISTQQKISTTKVGYYKNILSADEQKQIETELDFFFSLFGACNAITGC
jgi:hypothetical protein